MDKTLYLAMNSLTRETPWLHWFLAPYALWGGLVALSVLLVGAWWWARHQPGNTRLVPVAILTGVSVVVAVLVNQHLISPLIGRIRPCTAVSGVQVLLPCTSDYSMPSDHCIMAGAFAAGLWILNRRLGVPALLLALLLAFSRVYAGMHYPSDVTVGLLVGAGIGSAIVLGLGRPLARLLCVLSGLAGTIIVGPGRPADKPQAMQEAQP